MAVRLKGRGKEIAFNKDINFSLLTHMCSSVYIIYTSLEFLVEYSIY